MKTRRTWRARAGVLTLVLMLTVCTSAATASAATTRTVHGTVICTHGNKAMGVWVESTGGGSRWAGFYRSATHPNAGYFTVSIPTAAASTQVRLHVGCGDIGGGQWRSNLRTKYGTVSGNRTLNARCNDSVAGTRDNNCAWPQRGQLASPSNVNPVGTANRSQCTWEAMEKWKLRTGSFPFFGWFDAAGWADGAAARGWQVSNVPHPRSIVVFPGTPTNRAGHVAYVTKVSPVAGGLFNIAVEERNFDNQGSYRTWTYRHKPGMRYIVSTL